MADQDVIDGRYKYLARRTSAYVGYICPGHDNNYYYVIHLAELTCFDVHIMIMQSW